MILGKTIFYFKTISTHDGTTRWEIFEAFFGAVGGATWWVCAILSGLIVVDNINARGASKKSSKGLKMGKLIPLKVNPR